MQLRMPYNAYFYKGEKPLTSGTGLFVVLSVRESNPRYDHYQSNRIWGVQCLYVP